MRQPDEAETGVRAWKPAVPGIREVFHARFTEHVYPPHAHEVWTLFVVDAGRIAYRLHRTARAAAPSMVTLLPPHVAHDGQSAVDGGYRKRVLYLETSLIAEHLVGAAVDRPVVPGASLRRQLSALHDALGCIDDAFEAETRLHFVADRIRASLGEPPREATGIAARDLAEHLRSFLDAHLFETISMAVASAEVGVGATRLTRAFTAVFGMAPHAYVIARRIETARSRLLAGQPLADVAVEVGFHDQAHFTRRFKRLVGTTPGRFVRS